MEESTGRYGPSQVAPMVKRSSAIGGDVRDMVQSLGQKDPLEEGMATRSNILAWRIPMDRGTWGAIVHRIAQSDLGHTHKEIWKIMGLKFETVALL